MAAGSFEGRFDGKVAVITGAASGMGRATALRLASEGAQVFGAWEAITLMARHGGEGALGRHGEDGDSQTISTSVFAPAARRLYIALGNPCATPVSAFGFGARDGP